MADSHSGSRRLSPVMRVFCRASALAITATFSFLLPVIAVPAAHAQAAAAHPYAAHVSEAAQRFGIPDAWIWAVIRVESRGNPRALSPVGAIGLMQIMPTTWTMLTTRFGLGGDPYDPRANIHAGAAYLRLMWDRYGDIAAMLAAYNAGPGRVDDWRSSGRRLPSETIAYVAQIAPAIGGAGVTPPVGVGLAPAPSWRDASLFADRGSADIMPANSASDDEQGGAGQRASPRAVPAESAAAPTAVRRPTSGLFVPISGRSEQ